jgi:CBS domain-containing protein
MHTCGQIMTRDPAFCLPGDAVATAARLMRDKDIGAVPVVRDDSGKRVLGILTDRDLAVRVLATGRDPKQARVEDVMTSQLFTCRAEDGVDRAVEMMEEHQVRRIPVVEEGGRLVGMIAQADIATRLEAPKVLAELVEEISRPATAPANA